MAGRDKKAKNLPTVNSSRESPSASSKRIPPAADGREAADPAGSPADGKRSTAAAALKGGKAAKKKMNPATKINIARGRKKTKANFKLSIVKTQSMIAKKGRRGRPPLKKPATKDDVPEETEGDTAPEGAAKTRGRKKLTADETAEETDKALLADATETTKPTGDGDARKPIGKNVVRKVIKKKAPIGVKQTLTKKKILMAERAMKADGESVHPKLLKMSLAAKLKSAADRVDTKKDVPEQNKFKGEPAELSPSIADIKKEVDPEASSPIPDSGSTSPRLGSIRKLRKSLPGDSTAASSGAKSPYSTRSDRSKSPFPTKKEPTQKVLRNGKQRKLNDSLLAETVEQQFKKRRRLHSDSRESRLSDLGIEGISEMKKAKRLRSYSRDGSEISKCSDITESDMSICDNMSVDADVREPSKIAIKKEVSSEDLPADDLVSKDAYLNAGVDTASASEEPAAPVGVSMDNENNNTDGKSKTDTSIAVDKISNVEDSLDDSSKLNQNERLTEKSLILDNMSKTFNESSMTEKAKSIRRSARQRKSTVKAKEHEETVLAEKDALDLVDLKLLPGKIIRSDSEEGSVQTDIVKMCTPPEMSPPLKTGIIKKPEASSDVTAAKITAKKFYGDSNQSEGGAEKKSKEIKVKTDKPPSETVVENWPDIDRQVGNFLLDSGIKPGFDDADDNLDFDSGPVDESVKENIESAYTAKTFSNQDIDKLIDKLKVFEAQDKKRQEENLRANQSGKSSVMVTNDVVLISKSNADHIALKDIPNTVTIEKPKDKSAVLSRFENNSAISIIKKDQPRKSFEIELPSGVTLIKRTGTNSRKHSTGSNPKEDSVTMFDKALGKEVTLDLRKSIDKGMDSPLAIAKSQLPNASSRAVSISLKPNPSSISVETPLLSPNDDSIKVVSLKEVSVTEVSPKEAPVAIMSPKEPKMSLPSKEASARESSPKLPLLKEVTSIVAIIKELTPIAAIPKEISIIDVQSKILAKEAPPKETVQKAPLSKVTPLKEVMHKITLSKEVSAKVIPSKEFTTKPTTVKGLTSKDVAPKLITPKTSAKATPPKEVVPKVLPVKVQLNKDTVTKVVTPKEVPVKETVISEAVTPQATSPETPILVSQTPETAASTVSSVVNTSITIDDTASMQLKSSTVIESTTVTTPVLTPAVTPNVVASLSAMALPLVTAVIPMEVAIVSPAVPPTLKQIFEETPENLRQKEIILSSLGLLTHKAADEAKLEKQKQKELLIKTNKTVMPKLSTNDGYTGTLKTVIKLNRAGLDKKKGRSPLKMTFQKSKSRGNKSLSDGVSGDSESDENPYYTIHKEFGGASAFGTGSSENHMSSGGHRKTHYSNRFNNHDPASHDPLDVAVDPNPTGKEATLNLVIPEKASSFAIHPGRVCKDQCFYCGGKFGLFDTPCHVAQIKSLDRQKKILDNEEKLSSDSCLCDACYRHVDRRANCPSYRKRAGPGAATVPAPPPGTARDICHACSRPAPHTIRRKWLIKMRKSISKVVQLDLDHPGLHMIPLCDVHYEAVSHLMVCGLCKKKLSKNHVHYINQEYQALNTLLHEQGVPVVFEEKPVVCKSCREICTLLLRPPSQNQQKPFLLKNYRRRLMTAHNLEEVDKSDIEMSEYSTSGEVEKSPADPFKESRKGKNGKSKTKKSSDSHKPSDENNSSNGANAHNKDIRKSNESWRSSNQDKTSHGKGDERTQPTKPTMEEDIESLISSNKIPVPGSISTRTGDSAENSDADYDNSLDLLSSGMDNQSELQYLLQKCNVPRSTVLYRGNVPNLTQKSKNILKAQNAPAIFKTSHGQKITDKNAKRIQKLGQIITQKSESEPDTLKDRESLPLEAVSVTIMGEESDNGRDCYGFPASRNIALNDECTIETVPIKGSALKGPSRLNPSKGKLQLNDGFSRVIKNLNTLSAEQIKKKQANRTDPRFSNPVRRLETNPSISVRELFPGEEEMNLQGSVEFGNSKGVTPEGWERCNSTIQYDSDTKRLWHELQKPYGNQSSFLRHLVLLEKYFRNGDLVLSRRADCNAVTYSESVQNRLRSYDNIPTAGERSISAALRMALPKNSSITVTPHNVSPPPTLPPETILESVRRPESVSLIDFRKQKNPSGTGKSLLKTNQNSAYDLSKSVSARLLPPPPSHVVNQAKIPKNVPLSIAQINQSVDHVPNAPLLPKNLPMSLAQFEKFTVPPLPSATPRPPTPRPEFNFPRPPLPPPSATAEPKSAGSGGKQRNLPPELIAIPNPRKSLDNVLRNIQQLAKPSPVPDRPVPAPADSGSSLAQGIIAVAPAVSETAVDRPPPADPPKKAKGSSKQWRPTLIPITDESKARNCRDILYQTDDGRRLPSLVQVMSGGKPYYITIQDYNRMCVMRRQKLQQMQKAERTKTGSRSSSSTSQPENLESSATAHTSNSLDSEIPPVRKFSTPESPAQRIRPPPSETPDHSSTPSGFKTSTPRLIDPDLPSGAVPSPESCASLLKNVGLKNITIGPVSTAAEVRLPKAAPATITSQSLLLPEGVALRLDTAIESVNKSIAALAAMSSKPVAVASKAVSMPKIPMSLTVIPQLAGSPLAFPGAASVTPILGNGSPVAPVLAPALDPSPAVLLPVPTVKPPEP